MITYLRCQLYCVFLVPPSSVQLQAGNLTIRAGGLVTVVEDRVETLVCTTRNSNPAPRIAWMLGKMSDGELSTNLCKVSQCPEKASTRTFSWSKAPNRCEIETLVCKDHNRPLNRLSSGTVKLCKGLFTPVVR